MSDLAFVGDEEGLDHIAWLRFMAWGADPVLYPADVRQRFADIARELDQVIRQLDEITESSRLDTRDAMAWREAKRAAIASGKVVQLPWPPPLRITEAMVL